jgi:ADP-heptose:LPS heptosyltransferase
METDTNLHDTNRDPLPSTVIVWLSGALGDTILGFPALAALRAWSPLALITAIGTREYLALGKEMGLLDRVESGDGQLAHRLFSDATLPFTVECAVAWSSAFEFLRAAFIANGARRIVAVPPRGSGSLHQSRYLVDSLVALGIGIKRGPDRRRLPRSGQAVRFPAGIVDAESGQRIVFMHPGAGAGWKMWPVEHYLDLAWALRDRNLMICWSFGPADDDVLAKIVPRIPVGRDRVLRGLSLEAMSNELSFSSLVVSGDTGIAHLAGLRGAPQVTLFGPTDPRRWRPIGPRSYVLSAPNVCGASWLPSRQATDSASTAVIRRCAAQDQPNCRCLAGLSPARVLARCELALSAYVPQPFAGRFAGREID